LNFVFLQTHAFFFIARNDVRHAGIQYILDSVVLALDENPDRRFIYVEIAFFWRWWNQQTDDIRNKVRGFVNDGNFCLIIIQ
jgi:lysosomal alpha-mannosidase